jgi:hypothetical protein
METGARQKMLKTLLTSLGCDSTVVEHLSHNPKIKGSYLATGTITREKYLHLTWLCVSST